MSLQWGLVGQVRGGSLWLDDLYMEDVSGANLDMYVKDTGLDEMFSSV